MTDQSKYSVPNGQSFSLQTVKPSYTVQFHNGENTVGTFDFNGPKMTFVGDADASAKIFIDMIASTFVGRLKQERDQALEEAAKFCESQQVNHSPRGTRIFLPFDSECLGTHEGVYYAKAIREMK